MIRIYIKNIPTCRLRRFNSTASASHKIFNFSTVLFTLIMFFSCTAPIDINTRDSEPVIVIYGQLTDENKHQFIRITSSSPYFDNKTNPIVSDAKVKVTSSDGDEYAFIYEEDGYYVSDRIFAASLGITYHLAVEVDFDKDGTIETYEAETTILPIFPVDYVDIVPLSSMGYRYFSLNFYAQEPVETDNWYLFRILVNDSLANGSISKHIISEDEMYNGEYIDGASIYYLADATDEKHIKDREDQDSFTEEEIFVTPGDNIRVQILNIEKGYYNFILQCISEKDGENPFFGGPPSNITTNLSNGAVGYFAGFCIQEKATVVP